MVILEKISDTLGTRACTNHEMTGGSMKILVILLVGLVVFACGKTDESKAVDQEKSGVSQSGTVTNTISSADLAKNDGKNGRPAWVAYKGKVFDVSAVPAWKTGVHKGHAAGQDITSQIASSPHGDKVFSKLQPIGILGK